MLAVSSICLPRQFSCILSSLRLLTSAYRHELSLLFVTYFRSWIADLMDSREIHVHGNPIHLTIYCDSNWSQKHTGENVEIKISFLQFFLRLSLLHCFLRFFRNALINVKKNCRNAFGERIFLQWNANLYFNALYENNKYILKFTIMSVLCIVYIIVDD